MELTLIKTHHAVYQRHVDMLTKIPRQPFLIPLDTSHVWFLMTNSTNIKGQVCIITEDLSGIWFCSYWLTCVARKQGLGNKRNGNETIFNMHVLLYNSHVQPYWYQDQSHQCWCKGDDQKHAGNISKYVLQNKQKNINRGLDSIHLLLYCLFSNREGLGTSL